MAEIGIVTEKMGNIIKIKMDLASGCGSCVACEGHKNKDTSIEAVNSCGAKIGDTVSVDMERKVLTASLILYGIPLVALTIGIILGIHFSVVMGASNMKEPIGFGVGMLFLFVSYLMIRFIFEPRIKANAEIPVATEVIKPLFQ